MTKYCSTFALQKLQIMRFLVFFSTLFLLFASCNENTNQNHESEQGESEVVVPDTCICDDLILDDKYKHFYYHKNDRTEPYSGVCYTIYNNSDQKKMIKPLDEGKVEGKVIEYYPDGSLMAEYWFNENHVYDSLKRYFPDGRVKYHAVYKYGQIQDIIVNEVGDTTITQHS